ncbi:MAG: glucose 1-dehydrogenase [Bilifractor sp.]|jgi:NAD(P)-dependent dehydrogenase (short-subunit alcohol dehydrogenase family)
MRLENKTIVVTGASSGMGSEIVKLFAREGANVVAVARRKERLESLADSLKDCPGKVLPYPGDISLRETNESMIDAAVNTFGHLDGLVNNAGIMDDMSPVGDVTDEKYEKIMKVNLYGPMCAMRKAVNVFIEQGNGGSIINVSSVGGLRTVAGAAFCASKAALISMTKNTAYIYIPDKIRCNAIAPGGFNTEITNSIGNPNMTGYSRMQKIFEASPQTGDPSEIARAALYLISDEASYVSGVVLLVDGGWCAG